MAKQIINKDNNPSLRRHELKVVVVCADVSTLGWCVHKFEIFLVKKLKRYMQS